MSNEMAVKQIHWKVSVDIPQLSDCFVEKVRSVVYERIDSVMGELSADYGISWCIAWMEK